MPQQVQSNGILSQMVGLKAQKEAQQKQDQIGIWKSIVADDSGNYNDSQREMAAENLKALASDIVGGVNGKGGGKGKSGGNSGASADNNPLLSLFHAAIDKAHSITGSKRQQQQQQSAATAPDAAPEAVPYQEPMLQSQEQKDARTQQQANLAQKIALARAKAEQEQAAQVKREQNQQDYEQEYKRLLPSLGPGRAAEEANAIAAGRAVPAAAKTERTTTARDDAFQAYADAHGKDVKALTAAEKIAAVREVGGKDSNKLPGALGELAAAHKTLSDPAASPEDKAAAKEFITKENRVPQSAATVGETASDASEISQGIIAGTVPPDRVGLTRNGAWMKIQADLQKKGFNLAKAELDWQAAKRYVSTLNSQQQVRIREAASTLSQMIPDVEQKYQDWQKKGVSSGIKVFNKAGLEAAKNLPGEAGAAAQALETQIADMVSELGQVYMGGNSPTDHALSLAQKNLSGDWNKEQFDAALKLLKTNLGYRVNSIMNAGIAGASGDSPYTPPGGGGVVQPIVQHSQKTGQYRYSLDGGKTWQAGQPPAQQQQ